MKVKAKIVLDYCKKQQSKCDYLVAKLGEDIMDNCEDYMKNGDSCIWYRTKEIYIDKECKNISIEYDDIDEIILHIGKETYRNDSKYDEIEYLYIDDKAIVKDYSITREEEEAE